MQEYVIVDTDAFSYIFNNNDIKDFASKLQGVVPVLSFVSVGELFFGAKKQNWGDARMTRLEEQIRRYLIAPADDDLAKLWGQLKAQAARSGHSLGQTVHTNDLWICATAIYYNAPLLTNNRRHFENFPGLHLL